MTLLVTLNSHPGILVNKSILCRSKKRSYCQQEISLKKKIYDVMTEDIFDMSYVRIFKEFEKKKKGNVHTLLCLQPAELCLRNLLVCYSKMSVVMLLGYRVDGISRKLESERNQICPAQMLHI